MLKKILFFFTAVISIIFITSCDFPEENESAEEISIIKESISIEIDETEVDLGTQLTSIMEKYDNYDKIIVTLKANHIFTWNEMITIKPNKHLVVKGEGYTNGANDIKVLLRLTENKTFTYSGTDYRVPARALVSYQSIFELIGVEIDEAINDTRPLTMSTGKALFEIIDDFGMVEIQQSRLTVSEPIVNVGAWSYGRIKFGHFYADLSAGAPSSPQYVVTANRGWGYGGNGGVISDTITHLGTGIELVPSHDLSKFTILTN